MQLIVNLVLANTKSYEVGVMKYGARFSNL